MRNDFDKQVKNYLLKETDSAQHMQEIVWSRIESELKDSGQHKKRKRRYPRFLVATIAIAITVLIWAGLATTPGQAMIQQVKDLFVAEKNKEIELEGDKEQTNVQLEMNNELNYVIYIDRERYKLVKNATGDKVVPIEDLGDQYPEVSMKIMKRTGEASKTIDEIKNELEGEGWWIQTIEEVTNPVESTMIVAYETEISEQQWDTPVATYYILNETNGQHFLIKQLYFLEASEGHGVRFDSMLEDFEVITQGTSE